MSGTPATVGRTECGSAVCVQWFDRADRMPSKLRVEPIGDHQRDARARHKLAAKVIRKVTKRARWSGLTCTEWHPLLSSAVSKGSSRLFGDGSGLWRHRRAGGRG